MSGIAWAERIRGVLQSVGPVREKKMFGGISFMVNEKMVVSVRNDGDLMVRVDPQRSGELLAVPGARPAEMGPGRSMGPSWISVTPEATASDDGLRFWLDAALEYNSSTI